MDLDQEVLNLCRVVPLDILLNDSVKYPQNLPVYIEIVISEGRIPSEYISKVSDFPRYREAAIRGYKKLWKKFRMEDTGKSIIIDITPRDTFQGDRDDLLLGLKKSLEHEGKSVIVSKRASDCILDLYWLENRDDCRLSRSWTPDHHDYDLRDRSEQTKTGETSNKSISQIESLASSYQIPGNEEGDDV